MDVPPIVPPSDRFLVQAPLGPYKEAADEKFQRPERSTHRGATQHPPRRYAAPTEALHGTHRGATRHPPRRYAAPTKALHGTHRGATRYPPRCYTAPTEALRGTHRGATRHPPRRYPAPTEALHGAMPGVPHLLHLLLGVIGLLHAARAGTPVLLMLNSTGAVLEGDDVTLECVSQEGEDMSAYTFQRYSQWMKTWVNVDKPNSFRCWYYDINITREGGRLLLDIQDIQSWHAGPFRCVYTGDGNGTDISTESVTASENITIPVYYLRDVYLSRLDYWCGTVGSEEFIEEGSDVELSCRAQSDASHTPSYEWSRQGDDWIVASRVLKLKKMMKEQAGTYTCQARHPVIFSLVKTVSVKLTVVTPQRVRSFDSLFHASSTNLAMFIGIPALVLLLVAVAMGLAIRKRRATSHKKPLIEEPEQRSPIYKGSQESLPSRAGDTQPLVI